MRDENCAYCVGGPLVDKFGIKIADLRASKVYLFREQSHRGRVIVASKCHVSELVDLPRRERQEFMDDVATTAAALHKLFKPKKVNYGAYGDTGCHLHFHLVPKYEEDAFEWGGTFAMNPQRVFLSAAEYSDLVSKLRAALSFASVGFDLRQALIEMRRDIAADGKVDIAEATSLLAELTPLSEGSAMLSSFVDALRNVSADGVITPAESERILHLLDELLA